MRPRLLESSSCVGYRTMNVTIMPNKPMQTDSYSCHAACVRNRRARSACGRTQLQLIGGPFARRLRVARTAGRCLRPAACPRRASASRTSRWTGRRDGPPHASVLRTIPAPVSARPLGVKIRVRIGSQMKSGSEYVQLADQEDPHRRCTRSLG